MSLVANILCIAMEREYRFIYRDGLLFVATEAVIMVGFRSLLVVRN